MGLNHGSGPFWMAQNHGSAPFRMAQNHGLAPFRMGQNHGSALFGRISNHRWDKSMVLHHSEGGEPLFSALRMALNHWFSAIRNGFKRILMQKHRRWTTIFDHNFEFKHLQLLKTIRAALTFQDLSSNTKFDKSQSRETLPLRYHNWKKWNTHEFDICK